ncbi:M15 family metallopeptidase [Microtetraspora sp. NBRC 13810]|uniref:M15 family metallopeptidase n=1 Tax=Microtetraspora sp. NBRC 13810 TaxID=3030990 RepID=UPI0025564B61|nr:M15 family metallopeptidase [Microtetraspora sp. NBRC 13810]
MTTLLGNDVNSEARAATRSDSSEAPKRSANGWPIVDKLDEHKIEGSDLAVSVAGGPAAVILLHVARRFHYEVDHLKPEASEEVVGYLPSGKFVQQYESNHSSGTAIAIRPNSYPTGVSGSFFPHELVVIRDILAECEGVVRWGGDERVPKESHFQIDVRPDDERLAALAEKISKWNRTPGLGAGARDPFLEDRLIASRLLREKQRRN